MSKTLKKIIIILVIFALVGVGASLFLGGEGQTTNQLQSLGSGTTAAPLTQNATTNTSVADTEEINREFISMLLNLQTINLNDDIFSEPAFQALVDNTVRLNQPGNQGRPNPFAPIGTDDFLSGRNMEASASAALDSASVSESVANDAETALDISNSENVTDSNPLLPLGSI